MKKFGVTKFERNGVTYQEDAETKQQAIRSFKYSCRCCCYHGMQIDCDNCAIAEAHSNVMAAFDSKRQVAVR